MEIEGSGRVGLINSNNLPVPQHLFFNSRLLRWSPLVPF